MAAAAVAVAVGLFVVRDAGEPIRSEEDVAQQRCESETIDRLASPSTAHLSNVETTTSPLDADSRDLFSLLEPPLKNVDHSRIKVFNVAGIANSLNDFGDAMVTPFTCRAYFVDGNLAHTLVLFENH